MSRVAKRDRAGGPAHDDASGPYVHFEHRRFDHAGGGDVRTPRWLARHGALPPGLTADGLLVIEDDDEATARKPPTPRVSTGTSSQRVRVDARLNQARRDAAQRLAASPVGDADDNNAAFPRNDSGNSNDDSQSPKSRRRSSAQASSPAPTGVDAFIEELDQQLRGYVRQQTQLPHERNARLAALECVDAIAGDAGLHLGVYGSATTGVLLPTSDLDLCVTAHAVMSPADSDEQVDGDASGAASPRRSSASGTPPPMGASSPMMPRAAQKRGGYGNPLFVKMLRAMRRCRQLYDVRPIAHARVPIIKCRFGRGNLDVDVSFTADGVSTSQYLVEAFKQPDNVLARPLIVLVKDMLARAQINDPAEGGIGSFVVSILVLWLLRALRVGHSTLQPMYHGDRPLAAACEERTPLLTNEHGNLGYVFERFLQYYGEAFPFQTHGIDMLRGATFNKPRSSELHITNPLEPSRNAASAAKCFPAAKQLFARTYRSLVTAARRAVSPDADGMTMDAAAAQFTRTAFGAPRQRWALDELRAYRQQLRAQEQQQHRQQSGNGEHGIASPLALGVATNGSRHGAPLRSVSAGLHSHMHHGILLPSPVLAPTADPGVGLLKLPRATRRSGSATNGASQHRQRPKRHRREAE